MTESIEIDYTSEGQRLSWAALLELYDLHPHGWTLIGGQMVHLHCWARGVASPRVTTDADAGVDVRGFPQIAWTLTSTLQEIGFHLTGTSPNGGHPAPMCPSGSTQRCRPDRCCHSQCGPASRWFATDCRGRLDAGILRNPAGPRPL